MSARRVRQLHRAVPRQWKVVKTIREKFSCRDCEKISQAPAPFHAVPRGWAGPSLLAVIMFEKFGQHPPLNRQAERYALEGMPIAPSTMADAVGAVCASLGPCCAWSKPMSWRPSACMPMIRPCRCWPRARPIRHGAGSTCGTTSHLVEPARQRRCSTTRATARASIPRGILPDMPVSCGPTPMAGTTNSIWRGASPDRSEKRRVGSMRGAHLRHGRYRRECAPQSHGKKESPLSPIAVEVVRRIDALFEIERSINGRSAEERVHVRRMLSRPLVEDLQVYMREQLAKLSPWARRGQGVQLHPEALGELHSLPGGRPRLSQCRRARITRYSSRTKILVVLRL